MARLAYTLLLYLLTPILVMRLLWRSRQAPAYRQRISERLAWHLPDLPSAGIWIHAVSVGEVMAALPLIKALRHSHPNQPITLTCTTPTGSERIQSLLGTSVAHCYLPYDLPDALARFLKRLRPQLCIIMETELWPNLIALCQHRQIPVVLANARLSERSARGYARFSRLTQPMLRQLHLIAAQSEPEAQRFIALGASPRQVKVTGSIKFDVHLDADTQLRIAQLHAAWDAASRPVWLAASTHAGEETLILQAHQQLLQSHPDALLILVPRHPERFNAVADQVQGAKLSLQRRSQGLPDSHHQVYLGDSMGELLLLYALTPVSFVGGSLVAVGGHNLLEPALVGSALLSGPHLFNFQAIADTLRQAHALEIVEDADGLSAAVSRLWYDTQSAQLRCDAARQVLEQNRGALAHLLAALHEILPTPQN